MTAQRETRISDELPFTVYEAMQFDNAPCFIFGYNGENYYQPAVHACAKRYHAHHALAAKYGIALAERQEGGK